MCVQVDLETDAKLAAVESVISALNPTARQIRTQYSQVDLADILDLQALAGDR